MKFSTCSSYGLNLSHNLFKMCFWVPVWTVNSIQPCSICRATSSKTPHLKVCHCASLKVLCYFSKTGRQRPSNDLCLFCFTGINMWVCWTICQFQVHWKPWVMCSEKDGAVKQSLIIFPTLSLSVRKMQYCFRFSFLKEEYHILCCAYLCFWVKFEDQCHGLKVMAAESYLRWAKRLDTEGNCWPSPVQK